MLRLICQITITQKTKTEQFPVRNKTFIFKFVNNIEIESSWLQLTDTCSIILPKKVKVFDEFGGSVNLVGQSILGDSGKNPIMLRGDAIKVELGYIYPTATNPEVTVLATRFEGFISRINPRIPIEISCEDRMYQLKQIKTPNKVYSNIVYSVQDMIQEMLLQQPETKDISLITGNSLGEKIETNINDEFRTQDDTIASVLERLRKEAHLYSYFRGNELRCSGIVYYPSDREIRRFSFQRNIISDQLEYRRQDDIKMGAVVYSLNKVDIANGVNKDGSKKTKRKRLETFVGEKDGELRTLYFWDIKTEKELKVLGERELRKYYYTGYFGKFTTFGYPFVKHGDEVVITDAILPERNGSYLVKSVKTTFGMNGFRQEIELHFKLSALTTEQINNGL
jgi:hypothetical protein